MLKSCCTLIRGCTLFPARTIVRDSHHCNSPTCCWQDLNLCTNRCWFSGVVITTTPLHQHLLHHIKWIEIHSIYNKTSIQIHVATTYFSKQKQNILQKCQGMMLKIWMFMLVIPKQTYIGIVMSIRTRREININYVCSIDCHMFV